MNRTDFLVSWVGIDYDDSLPARRFRRLGVRWHNWRWQTLGLERVSMGIRFSIKATFLQLLEHPDRHELCSRLAEQGRVPAIQTEDSIGLNVGFASDRRKKIQLKMKLDTNYRPEIDSWPLNLSLNLNWRPAGRARASVSHSTTRAISSG